MSPADAVAFVAELRKENGGKESTRHVATTTWRETAIQTLSREDESISGVVLVELYLLRHITDIDDFYGIFAVDEVGIWFYDGDGHIDENVWRQRLIQWRDIDQIIMHRVS